MLVGQNVEIGRQIERSGGGEGGDCVPLSGDQTHTEHY